MAWTEKQIAFIMADLADENAFACQALLAITDVRFTGDVETLAVSLSDAPELRINPGFLDTHAETEADVRGYLLHEFLHVVLRHTEKYTFNTPLLNIALDAVINAIIHRTCGAELSDTFRRLYPPTGWAALLRPWETTDPETTRQWKPLHDRIYQGRLAADDLHEVLQALGGNVHLSGALFIGNHSPDTRVSDRNRKILDGILERMDGVRIWNHRPDPGTGDRRQRLEQRLREARIDAWLDDTARLIGQCLTPDPDRQTHTAHEVRLPILSPRDRRAFALFGRSLILPFTTHEASLFGPDASASVYLDASGSMDDELQLLASLLHRFHTRIRRPLWTFSNQVREAGFRGGKLVYETTSGTSAACVFDHIRRQGVARNLIVTDGYVEPIRKDMLRGIDPKSLRILVTAKGSTGRFTPLGIPCLHLKPLHR